jgi:hypothetical protein
MAGRSVQISGDNWPGKIEDETVIMRRTPEL